MTERALSADLQAEDLLEHDRAAPRYTSYPTAPNFDPEFGPGDYEESLRDASRRADDPMSLYVHIPFCKHMCTFCGCTTWVPSGEALPERYFAALDTEIELVTKLLGERRTLCQMHWGGGTPNWLSPERTEELLGRLLGHFRFAPDAEVALEVNPTFMEPGRVAHYAKLGFNRISMGVQDFEPQVQEAIGRIQSFEDTQRVIDEARAHGFSGINVDLIYGLPHQTEETMARTLERVRELRPDRVAAYSFAFLPEIKGHQKRIEPDSLPEGRDKWAIFARIHRHFIAEGYRAIGMDHFALPDDELSLAQGTGRLRRNFQGYTVLPADEVIGLGISAIGDVAGAYVQNAKSFRGYTASLAEGRLPVARGLKRSRDDVIRRAVIESLMCDFRIDWAALADRHGLDVRSHVQGSLERLEKGPEARFYTEGDGMLELTERGRPFVRNVAMAFDAYVDRGHVFSRSV
jgi:oxygen-independent coproporphyrinogen-3 oxidase